MSTGELRGRDDRFCVCGAERGHYGSERCKPKPTVTDSAATFPCGATATFQRLDHDGRMTRRLVLWCIDTEPHKTHRAATGAVFFDPETADGSVVSTIREDAPNA